MTWVERLALRGIRRTGNAGTGYRYELPDGSPAAPADVERIASLAIPPAWTDVSVNAAPRAAPKAVGRDAGEDGKEGAVKRKALNDYIKDAMGGRFGAKDFRTWAGSILCAGALARTADAADGPKARKRKAAAAVRETADRLGNTPAVRRASTIAPAVLEGFPRTRIVLDASLSSIEELVEKPRLDQVEEALLRLLRGASAGPAGR